MNTAGLDRPAAARFSFLFSIPAVVLSGLFELRKAGDGAVGIAPTIVATAITYVVGYASVSAPSSSSSQPAARSPSGPHAV